MMHRPTLITNVKLFTRDEGFVPGVVAVDRGRIRGIVTYPDERVPRLSLWLTTEAVEQVDGQGCYCLPGFIDLHFHGCAGYDVCDGTPEALQAIADYELAQGVTSICPATMTLPEDELEAVLRNAAAFRRQQRRGAQLVGLQMEGPFISPLKKGAQREDCIRPADPELFRRFETAADGLLKIMGLAPEASNADAFLEYAADRCVVSLAHSNADYDSAAAALEAGVRHVTHLFNAMPPLHHRNPGLIGAAAERDWVTAELICDGVHVHPSAVRAAYRLFGAARLILISDSIRATGLKDGSYTLGGQSVTVRGQRATLADGTLVGSVTNLSDCVRRAVQEMHIPLDQAVACASCNPARRLGIDRQVGALEQGLQADLQLWDSDLQLRALMQRGNWIRREV